MDKFNFKIEYGSFYPLSAIESEIGIFLYKLIVNNDLKKVLEFGTGIGKSALYIASALKDIQGKLYTYDKNQEFLELAEYNLEKNNLKEFVEFNNLDLAGIDWSKFYNNNYDLIFIDTKKSLYKIIFVNALQHLNDNGFIIIDDVFIDKTKQVRKSVVNEIVSFREYLLTVPNIKIEEIRLGDGVFVVSKI